VVCATWAPGARIHGWLLTFCDRQSIQAALANASGPLVGKYIMTHFHSRHPMRCSTTIWKAPKGTIGGQFMSYEALFRRQAHKGAFGSTLLVCGAAAKASGLTGLHNAPARFCFGAKTRKTS